MKDTIILQDKIYISAKRVHEIFGYTSDYVGQLCRAGKLEARMVGRSWFVTEKSVADHKIQSLKVLNPRIASEEVRIFTLQGIKMAILSLVFGGALLAGVYASISSQVLMTASLGSTSQAVVAAFKNLFITKTYETVIIPSENVQGMVVVPSTGSVSANAALEKKIRNSFSDEVVVSANENNQSGVITPVFKEAKGEEFMYVMVPVDESP